jgi:sugar phosphate isomerase/epimerase
MRLSCPEQMLGDRPLSDKVTLIRDTGFDGIDLRYATLTDPANASLIHALPLPIGAVYSQIREPSLLSPTAQARADAVAEVVARARRAAQLGAERLILVPIFGSAQITLAQDDEAVRAAERALFLVSLKEISDALTNIPLTIVLEPLNAQETHLLRDPVEAAEWCAIVGSPRIQTMVDTYHCYQEGYDIPGKIRGVGDHLALVHLSDANRGLPGEGEVNFEDVLRTLQQVGYDGWAGYECRPIVTADDLDALHRSVALIRSLMAETSLVS